MTGCQARNWLPCRKTQVANLLSLVPGKESLTANGGWPSVSGQKYLLVPDPGSRLNFPISQHLGDDDCEDAIFSD
jgi:hypothetical protein